MNNTLKWPLVKLSTLAAKDKNAIVGGPFGSDLVSRDYVPEGVPVVRGGNLPKHSNFSCEGFVFVSERKADSLHLNCAKPGDIVFTQRGTLGQVGIVPKNTPYSRFLISQSQMKMTVDSSKANSLYLYYYFRLPSTVSYIENHALQSGVPHINLGILRKFDVVYPPLPIQDKIAAVLSAYDDLIETNKRRIALLEKMAEEIYREWFVRLRFPGHEKVKFEKGVPANWEALKVGQLFKTSSGGTPLRETSANYGGDICWAKTGELKSTYVLDTEEKITLQGLENSSAKVYPKHTVVIAMYCAMADISILGVDSATNQACCVFFPKSGYLHYTFNYLLLKSALKHMINFAHGAAQQNLSQDLIKGFQVLTPSKNLIVAFSKLAEPIFKQVEALMRANVTLTTTRDRLLPRLISGKLSVENLDIQFPPSMQAEAAS